MLCVGAVARRPRAASRSGPSGAAPAGDACASARACASGGVGRRARPTRARAGARRRRRDRPGSSTRSTASRPICPHGGAYAWTRKQGGVRADGHVVHRPRHARARRASPSSTTAPATTPGTAWQWSAGVGRDRRTGARSPGTSSRGSTTRRATAERTVWLDGVPVEAGAPPRFADDLSAVATADGARAALRRRRRRASATRTCCWCAASTASRSAPSPARCPAALALAAGCRRDGAATPRAGETIAPAPRRTGRRRLGLFTAQADVLWSPPTPGFSAPGRAQPRRRAGDPHPTSRWRTHRKPKDLRPPGPKSACRAVVERLVHAPGTITLRPPPI